MSVKKEKILAKKIMDFLNQEKPNPQNAFFAIAYLAAYLIDTQARTEQSKSEAVNLMSKVILDFLKKANDEQI